MNKIPNRQVICDVLVERAEKDKDIVVLCSDSRGSASLSDFTVKYPEQFVEVGIAEQNLVSISAGLAACGKKAFAASPACFLSTRSMEQAKVDVAYSNTNVKLIGISGGISYGALFGQGCHKSGMAKATYGTGSSVMMNIGKKAIFSESGLATSIAWGISGEVEYVLEGNINYAGAVIKWIESLGLISSPKEAPVLAKEANPNDSTYLVPAFSGLGAPYWESGARALFYGMSRSTGKAEIVKAAEECIAYQIADIINAMVKDSGMEMTSLRVDGGPTRDEYLMQFQSDILGIPLLIPQTEELSGMGAAYAAGIAAGIYDKESIFAEMQRKEFKPQMAAAERGKRCNGWKKAIKATLML